MRNSQTIWSPSFYSEEDYSLSNGKTVARWASKLNSQQGQNIQWSGKLQKIQELHLTLWECWHVKGPNFMIIKLEKEWTSMLVWKDYKEKVTSLRKSMAAWIRFAKLHKTKWLIEEPKHISSSYHLSLTGRSVMEGSWLCLILQPLYLGTL